MNVISSPSPITIRFSNLPSGPVTVDDPASWPSNMAVITVRFCDWDAVHGGVPDDDVGQLLRLLGGCVRRKHNGQHDYREDCQDMDSNPNLDHSFPPFICGPGVLGDRPAVPGGCVWTDLRSLLLGGRFVFPWLVSWFLLPGPVGLGFLLW